MNALGPSFESSLFLTASTKCASILNAICSGMPRQAFTDARICFTANGPFALIRSAISLAFAIN